LRGTSGGTSRGSDGLDAAEEGAHLLAGLLDEVDGDVVGCSHFVDDGAQ